MVFSESDLKTRADLARLVPDGGLVIELGVASGDFAVELLRANPTIRYMGIDRWADHHDENERQTAQDRLCEFPGRHGLCQFDFSDAVSRFTPGSADMVYVDGYAHTGQEGGKTLDDWWPVVKPGGIFAGHDYCAEYQPTIDAVDRFVRAHGLELRVIEDGKHPSWWVRKP